MTAMLGWFSAARLRASLSKRATRPWSWKNSSVSTFSATSLPSFVSFARYTSPMPPAPSGARISYGPRRAPAASVKRLFSSRTPRTVDAGDPLGRHEAGDLLPFREADLLPVGRDGEGLGGPVRVEAGEGPARRRRVPARQELLDEDPEAAFPVDGREGDGLSVWHPARAPGVLLRASRGGSQADRERHERPVGDPDHLDRAVLRLAREREEGVLAVGRHFGPFGEAGEERRRLGAVGPDLPDTEFLLIRRRVDHPLSIGRGRRVFRVEAVVRDLPRPAAVGVGHPDLEVTRTIRAEDQMLAVRREGGVVVHRGAVGEASDGAGPRLEAPDVDVAAAKRRIEDPLAVRRVPGLAVHTQAASEPGARRGDARRRKLAEVDAIRVDVEDDPAGAQHVDRRDAGRTLEHGGVSARLGIDPLDRAGGGIEQALDGRCTRQQALATRPDPDGRGQLRGATDSGSRGSAKRRRTGAR